MRLFPSPLTEMSSKSEERLNSCPYSKPTNLKYKTSHERLNTAPTELSPEMTLWGRVMTDLQGLDLLLVQAETINGLAVNTKLGVGVLP